MPTTSGFRPVEFTSDGATVRGRLYLTEGLPAPLVIMAHGFSATVPMTLDRYAKRFERLTGPKDLLEVDGGHFGIIEHPSAAFELASEAQAAWLSRTMGATA